MHAPSMRYNQPGFLRCKVDNLIVFVEPDLISYTSATLHQPIFKATANRYMFIFENMQLVNKGLKVTISFTSIAGIIKIKLGKRRRNGKS